MTTEETSHDCAASRSTAGLGGAKLTSVQIALLAKAKPTWERLPGGVGCTNLSISKLERLKLVELTLEGLINPGGSLSSWRWRLVTPNVEVRCAAK